MKPSKIAVFGCKSSTWSLISTLRLPVPIAHLITIGPELGQRNEVADYMDLGPLATRSDIPFYRARSYALKDAEDVAHISGLDIDIAFVIGWQRLIPEQVLKSFRIGAFGMHGSSMDLPLGRGRSPMNWALIEGRSVFYSNLFRYDPGMDSGDVVGTVKFGVGLRDTAETMHFKNLMAMKHLIELHSNSLLSGDVRLRQQDGTVKPTYYPKRAPADGMIDLAHDVYAIDRSIRAVTRPFDGAFTFHEGHRITIFDAQVFDQHDFGFENARPGTVVMLFSGGKFLLKCIGGLLLVNDYEAGFEVRSGMAFRSDPAMLKVFPRNDQGNHDREQG